MRRLRLQHRIAVPFVLVVVAATTAAAVVALSVTRRALQERVRAQLAGAAAVVGRGDLALNPLILRNVQAIMGADVITVAGDGSVVASTLTDDQAHLIDAVDAVLEMRPAPLDGETAVAEPDCGVPCLVAYRRVEGRPDAVVALLAETSELTAATRAVTRTIVLGAGLSAVVVVLVGQLVVRRVTAPLQRLVQFARELSPGRVDRRAPVTSDEVGELAEAFNGMLDRLQHSQDALVRTEKLALAGLMAARVAHDIRNPLSSIKMQTQLLQARLRTDPEDEATVTAILHDINQVESVIRDLVELARPGDYRRKPMPVNDLVREALQQLSAQFTHRKIAVRLRLADGLPDIALDATRFRQALLNLLVNASEAMPTGGEIEVASRADASTVVVSICDDGIGVDPALLDKVFDPFVSTKPEGVGLGLVNVKAVVEGHGGRIQLVPRQPKGTCASITLPFQNG